MNCFGPGGAGRWRWGLLIFGVTLLLLLTVFMSYLARNFVKSEFALFCCSFARMLG